jgi:hypothetical protein
MSVCSNEEDPKDLLPLEYSRFRSPVENDVSESILNSERESFFEQVLRFLDEYSDSAA